MKIAVPVDDKSMDTSVCQSFGRAPYFLFYDTESQESTFLENGAVDSPGGAGVRAAQTIVDNKVTGVLTPRCGQNAAEVIKAADIEIYKTVGDSLKENIQAFTDGKLFKLEEIHAGFHRHRAN